MTEPSTLRAPTGLKRNGWGQQVWRRFAKKYEMAEYELLLLEKLARNEDVLGRLEPEAATALIFIAGSRGQLVINPIFEVVRQHRLTSAKLVAQLAFGDAVDPDGKARSSAGRAMARARWNGR